MYHVSSCFLGISVFLTPKVPNARNETECSITKRICVAPSIKKCLLAIDGISDLKYSGIDENGWYVYHTTEVGYPAKEVFDYEITNENWLLKESEFKYIGKVFLSESNEIIIEEYREAI
jgi:hypothetical protein